MKTYGFSRKIQLKNYIPNAKQYESADFFVDGCDSKEEAIKDVMDWIEVYVIKARESSNKEEPFSDHALSDERRIEIAEEVQARKDKEWDKK